MNKLEQIIRICASEFNPSVKIGLIALLNEGEPMTTADLNNTLNLHKTFQNYQDLFEDFIDAGLIRIVAMKTKAGITRQHFEICDVDSLINSLD